MKIKLLLMILVTSLMLSSAPSHALQWELGINAGSSYFYPNQPTSSAGSVNKADFGIPVAGAHFLFKIKFLRARTYLEYQSYRFRTTATLAGGSYSDRPEFGIVSATGFASMDLGFFYLGPGGGIAMLTDGSNGFFPVVAAVFGVSFSKLFFEIRFAADATTLVSSPVSPAILSMAQLGWTIF